MAAIKIVHFKTEDVEVKEVKARLEFVQYADRRGLRPGVIVDPCPGEFKRKVFEGVKIQNQGKDAEFYYFDIENVREAIPVIQGIIAAKTVEIIQQKMIAEKRLEKIYTENRRLADELTELKKRFLVRVVRWWDRNVGSWISAWKAVRHENL